jgi:hypothetical protein
MPENLGQKGLTNIVKVCVKITPDFVSKWSNGCQKGDYEVKRESKQAGLMYTGFSRCRVWLLPVKAAHNKS